MPEVSVVIPTMNEEATIWALIHAVRSRIVAWYLEILSVGNEILNIAFRSLYDSGVRDSQSGMWSFRRSILARLPLVHDGMAFSEELKLEAIRGGFRFLEIPVEYRIRVGDKKIRSVSDATGNLIWLARKRVGWVPRVG